MATAGTGGRYRRPVPVCRSPVAGGPVPWPAPVSEWSRSPAACPKRRTKRANRCRTSAASWLPVVRWRGRKRSLPCHNPTWVSGPTRPMAGFPAISANRPEVCQGFWQVIPPSPCHNPAWVSGPTPLVALRAHDDGGPSAWSSHRELSSANRPQRCDHAAKQGVGQASARGVAGAHPITVRGMGARTGPPPAARPRRRAGRSGRSRGST